MANQYFLRIDGIDGEATQKGFEHAIEPVAWSWGVSAPTASSGGGGRSGRPQFDELQIVTRISRASPELVESCVTGRHHNTAVLTGLRTGDAAPVPFVRYELGDVTVTSIEHNDADDDPIEEVALAYRELSITYTTQRADGTAGPQTSFSHP